MATAGREMKHQNDFVNGLFLIAAVLLSLGMVFWFFSMNNGGDRSSQTQSAPAGLEPSTSAPNDQTSGQAPSTTPGETTPAR